MLSAVKQMKSLVPWGLLFHKPADTAGSSMPAESDSPNNLRPVQQSPAEASHLPWLVFVVRKHQVIDVFAQALPLFLRDGLPGHIQHCKQFPQQSIVWLGLPLLDFRQIGHRADPAAQRLLTPVFFSRYIRSNAPKCQRIHKHSILLVKVYNRSAAAVKSFFHRKPFFREIRLYFCSPSR